MRKSHFPLPSARSAILPNRVCDGTLHYLVVLHLRRFHQLHSRLIVSELWLQYR